MSTRSPRIAVLGLAALLVGGSLAACSSDESADPTPSTDRTAVPDCRPATTREALDPEVVAAADTDGATVRLLTHDSFDVDPAVFDPFTDETGIQVELIEGGDAGVVVSQAVLTAGNPVADVLFGIDTTFLCRGTSNDVFIPYRAAAMDRIPADLQEAPDDLLTPIDVGDVCLNISLDAFPDGDGAPSGLADLTDPAHRDAFVTENPETSSPGMAFLLATIAEFGEDGWQDYWTDLRDNGVLVTSGWTEAWEDHFEAGRGDRSIVTSYASSPVADVLYADPPRDETTIGVVTDACFRQIEYAGILRGTEQPEAAALLVDFLLSPEFQSEIPLAMFVDPVHPDAEIPAEYAAHRIDVTDPLRLDPAEIEAGRDRWTETWTELVLR